MAYAVDMQQGDEAHDFTLMTVEGDTASLSDYKDEILVFVYWKPSQKRSVMALTDAAVLSKKYSKEVVHIIGITAHT